MIYILVQKSDRKVIGIFSTEEIARGNAIEGEYLIIPVELDRRYDGGIVSEAMAGAINIKATGTELSEAVQEVLSRLDTIETQISNASSILTDLDTRITALEGA